VRAVFRAKAAVVTNYRLAGIFVVADCHNYTYLLTSAASYALMFIKKYPAAFADIKSTAGANFRASGYLACMAKCSNKPALHSA